MLSTIKAYFKIAWACKTPFVFLLDSKYKTISLKEVMALYANILTSIKYLPEFHDCDDYAWIMKAIANTQKLNAIGFVIGWVSWHGIGLHAWNVVLCNEGVYQLEPQNAEIFKKGKGYHPLVIII